MFIVSMCDIISIHTDHNTLPVYYVRHKQTTTKRVDFIRTEVDLRYIILLIAF